MKLRKGMVYEMGQAVIIKSSKNGITLVLNPELEFPVLLGEILNKFRASEFFSNAEFAVSFEGRELSDAEKYQIVDCIMSETTVRILCIIENDELRDAALRRKMDEHAKAAAGRKQSGSFYHGNLKSGERLETDESIIIIGDVPKGASVVSAADIIVLGTLSGSAYAGIDGREGAFIAALCFAPEKYNIGGIYGEPLKKERGGLFSKRNKAPLARLAVSGGGFITVKPLKEGLYNII